MGRSLSLAPPLAPSWALHHKQFLLKGALCHHTRHTPHLWRQLEKKQQYGKENGLSKYFQSWNPVFTLGKRGQLCCFPPWSPSLIYIYEAKYEPGDCDPICKPTTLSHLRISSKKTLFMETEVNKIKWMAFEDQSEKYLFIILSTQTASLLTYCAPPSTPNGWPISALPTPWGHFLYEHWTARVSFFNV